MFNQHPLTGVRYGVIALNNLDDDIAQTLMFGPGATNLSYAAAYEEARCGAGNQAEEEATTRRLQPGSNERKEFVEDRIELLLERFSDCYQDDEPHIEGTYQGIKYQISWLGGAPLLWVFESPSIVDVQSLCSPCVPNAGDLDSGIVPAGEGYPCYGVPEDWMPSHQLTLELHHG